MIVEFNNAKLAKNCSTRKAMIREWGPEGAKKIQQRLADLEEAETLEDFRYLPGRLHPLLGDRNGQFALDLKHPRRLIFKPNNSPLPKDTAGKLDWGKVTKILILEIVDYH